MKISGLALTQMVSFPESSIEEIANALGTKPESIRYQRRLMQDKVVTEKISSKKRSMEDNFYRLK